jgi:hypothetical protein
MAKSPNFIHVYENILSKEDCHRLIEAYEELATSDQVIRTASEDLNVSQAERSDSYFFLETTIPTAHAELATRLKPSIQHFLQTYPGIDHVPVTSISSKMQKCSPGQGYHTFHWEQTPNSPLRAVVWLLYLNDIYEGGETELLNFGERISPREGRLLVFPAAWPWIHRGNPPLVGTKYIVTGWYNYAS